VIGADDGRRGRRVAAAFSAAWILASGAARADDAFEQRLLAELRAVSPDAAVAFQQANEARDKNDLARASEYYAEVHKMAPGFVAATRRQCNVELSLGHREPAIALCREALKTKETPENLSSLAAALASPDPTPAETAEAVTLAGKAMTLAPDDVDAHEAACGIAQRAHDLDLLRRCATRLQALAPDSFTTQIYYTHLALQEGRPGDAEAALEKAHKNGLPEPIYQSLMAQIRESSPLSSRVWWQVQVNWRWIFAGVVLVAAVFLYRRAQKAEKAKKAGEKSVRKPPA
jgi:tetratricopeptide (TPR) repeat protein